MIRHSTEVPLSLEELPFQQYCVMSRQEIVTSCSFRVYCVGCVACVGLALACLVLPFSPNACRCERLLTIRVEFKWVR